VTEREVDFNAANADERDDDAVQVDGDTLASTEELDLAREIQELRRRLNRVEEDLQEERRERHELEKKLDAEKATAPDYVSQVERWERAGEYGGLQDYERRVTKIWAALPRYAQRTTAGQTTEGFEPNTALYTLDHHRTCDALAAVDADEWQSGEKVASGQVGYARDVFEDESPALIDSKVSGEKVVVIAVKKWALDRPDKIARRLMKLGDVEEYLTGGK